MAPIPTLTSTVVPDNSCPLTGITDARGVKALDVEFDPETGRVTTVQDASGASVNLNYNTDIEIDGQSLAVEMVTAGNTKTETLRDSHGNVVREVKWLEDAANPGEYSFLVTVYRYSDPVDPKLETHESFLFEVPADQFDNRFAWLPGGGPAWKTVSAYDDQGNLKVSALSDR